jgi:hypothetical protein
MVEGPESIKWGHQSTLSLTFFRQNDGFEVSQTSWNPCKGDWNQPGKSYRLGLWVKD